MASPQLCLQSATTDLQTTCTCDTTFITPLTTCTTCLTANTVGTDAATPAADLASESRSSWLQLGSWVGAQEWGSRLSTGVLGRWGLTASWCEVELLRGERGGRAARLQDWTREATIWSTRVPYRSLSSFWLGAERSRSFGGLVGGARARVRQGPRAQPTRSGSEGSIPDRSPRLTNKGTGGCSPWLDGEYAGSPQVSLEGAQGRPWVTSKSTNRVGLLPLPYCASKCRLARIYGIQSAGLDGVPRRTVA